MSSGVTSAGPAGRKWQRLGRAPLAGAPLILPVLRALTSLPQVYPSM